MLAIRLPGNAVRISRTARADSASPASTTCCAVTATLPCDSTWENADGTALIRLAVHRPARGSARASRTRTTSILPPTTSGQKISKTETSKLSEVEATTRDSPEGPKSELAHAARLPTPLWATTTPLGRPVEPEV